MGVGEGQTVSVPLASRALGFASARYEILSASAEKWPVAEQSLAPVQDILRISRAVFAHGSLVWEFFAVGTAWSVIAVELALRDVMQSGDRIPFRELISEAERKGRIESSEAKALDAGAQLRNNWMHGKGFLAMTPGMAEEMILASHMLVAKLYED